MKRWLSVLLLLGLTVALPSVGEAAQRLLDSPRSANASVPGRVQQAGVSVEVQVIDAEQTRNIFDVDLVGEGIQPLLIKIRNESGHTYRFSKASVDAHYLPAATVARKAYENPIVIGGEMIGRVVGVIPKVILPSTSHRQTPSQPLFNREVRASFMREEIADGDIGPNGSLAGFMYVRPLAPGSRISVRLINVQTQEPLTFDIPT